MGNWTQTNLSCPCGISSDAFSIDGDGNGYCFRGDCKRPYFNKDRLEREEYTITQVHTLPLINKSSSMFSDIRSEHRRVRGLSESTCRFYDIRTILQGDTPKEIGFKYPSGGYKYRGYEEKVFRSEGDMKTPGLYGRDKFDPGSRESVTITEGEFDAASIYEASRAKTAAVSIRSASSAKRDCIADRDFLNSFKKIIICFDNDEPGQKAAKEVSSLFDFTKVYHVKLQKYKDANEYLQNNEGDNLYKAWDSARRYAPDNIISSFAEIEAALAKSKEDQLGTFPFNSLQSMTYGIHAGEVIVVKGPEGIGKTEIFRAIEHHLLKTTPYNIGILHFEEDNATTIKGIAGYELNQPAILPDSNLSPQDIFEGYKAALKNDDTRVHLYQSFDTEEEDIFFDNIRFLVAGAGCRFIFLDHISWLATGKTLEDDERKKLDRISQKLKLLAKELEFAIIMISHVNDSGQTRGSRNITKVANTVIHLERDKVNPDPSMRRTTFVTLEKVRLGGATGPAGKLILDPVTYKLRETDFEQALDIPN